MKLPTIADYMTDDELSNGWIKCSDRLPEYYQQVLLSNGKYIDTGYRNRDDELYCAAALMLKSLPTYWQPLPEPPE
jgi:hypothetical protein